MTEISYNAEFASQVIDTLPIGYIDKTICGCGFTTVALENKENAIIAVPSIHLINNKVVQYPNKRCLYTIFGVYSGITINHINNYISTCLSNNHPIKIMVTYDGLPKLESLITKYNCKLIIDESNKLLSSATMKSNFKSIYDIDTVTKVFNITKKYKDVTSFISATPTPLEYLPKWVSSIPYTKIHWKNTTKAKPLLMQRRSPLSSLINEIVLPLKANDSVTIAEATFNKVIIFINSIKDIIKVCNECELSIEDVGIIAGTSLKNDLKIKGYKRLEDPNNLPKYTFSTSAGFEGIDLNDSNAISVVVSSTTSSYQMVDIMTDLKQAISRQRNKNNPNYDKFIYLYNHSIFDKTDEELSATLDYKYSQMVELLEVWEDLITKGKDKAMAYLAKNGDFKTYINYNPDTDLYEINENLFNADKYFIMVTRKQYEKGFDISNTFEGSSNIIQSPTNIKLVTYKDMVKEYLKTKDINVLEQYKYKLDYYNLIIDCIRLYNKVWVDYSYAKRMVDSYGNEEELLIIDLQSTFKVNSLYTVPEIKELLTKIYSKYNISRTPKATDLNEFFETQQVYPNRIRHTKIVSIIN